MKHKTLRTLLCVILTVCFCMSAIVPASAAGLFGGDWSAASTWDQMMRNLKDWFGGTDTQPDEDMDTPVPDTYDTTSGTDGFIRIFHLDCGRRYFSVKEITTIIDYLAENHYTHIELGFGNDGFRFLLDNMEVVMKDGTTYSSENVTAAIKAGNTTYSKGCNYYPDVNELTQEDMDAIISYAKSKQIGVIPLIDIPGHSNALIDAMNNPLIGINVTSHTTGENIYNVAMRAFDITNATAVEFVSKLVEKYIDYFAENGSKYFNLGADECGYTEKYGFSYGETEYTALAKMLNDIGSVITSKNMTPMVFNDGFRPTNGTDYLKEKVSKDFVICYWTENSYTKAAVLAEKFNIINTHNGWYYVVGNNNSSWAGYDTAINNFKSIKCTSCDSGYTTGYGCMLAVWCDQPKNEPNLAKSGNGKGNIHDLIKALADSNPNYFKAPATPTITASKASLAVGETATLSVSNADNADIEWSVTNDKVLKLNTIAANSTTANASVQVEAIAEGTSAVNAVVGTTTLSVDITVSATRGDEVVDKTITVSVGSTTNDTIKNVNETFSETECTDSTGKVIAKVSAVGKAGSTSDTYTKVSVMLSELAGENTSYTKTDYYYKTSRSNNYYPVYAYKRTQTRYGTTTTYYYYGYEDNNGSIRRIDYSSSDKSVTLYTKNDPTPSTTVTFEGVAIGTTYVTVGGVRYKVNVIEEKLTGKTLPIQPWFTNCNIQTGAEYGNHQTTGAFGSGSWIADTKAYYVEVKDSDVFGADGKELTEILPNAVDRFEYGGTYWVQARDGKTSKNMVVWSGRIHTSSNIQTIGGTDYSNTGTEFKYIRFLGGKFEVSADRKNWTKVTGEGSTVSSSCTEQLAVYYMMRTEITKEVTTDVADWGYTSTGEYNDVVNKGQYVVLDFAVKYPGGTRSPDTFPVPGKTFVFHCNENSANNTGSPVRSTASGEYYRQLNNFRAVENIYGYEIYMVTVTMTEDDYSKRITSSGTAYDLDTTIKYNGEEQILWAIDAETQQASGLNPYTAITAGDTTYSGCKLGTDGYDPYVRGVEVYEAHGALITYYIRAKVIESSLTVNYFVEGATEPFYTYPISVDANNAKGKFKETIALNDPWKGPLFDGDVENIAEVTEWVTADLGAMPEIRAQYRFSEYECVKVVRESEKVVNLYYTFKADKSFVVDFGLPLKIVPTDLSTNLNTANIESATVKNTSYATVESRNSGKEIIYTLTKPLNSVDTFTITYKGTNITTGNEGEATFTVNIIPATNVYYEESFMTLSGDGEWKLDGNLFKDVTQTLDSEYDDVYGFDSNINAEVTDSDEVGEATFTGPITYSMDQAYKSTLTYTGTRKASDTTVDFTFTGNGFDLISECSDKTGILVVTVDGHTPNPETGKVLKYGYIVDTFFCGDDTAPTPIVSKGTQLYQVPVIRELNMPYDTYDVKVRAYVNAKAGVVVGPVAQTISLENTDSIVDDILLTCGITDISAEDMTVLYMDSNSILNSGTGISNNEAARDMISVQSVAELSDSETDSQEVEFYVDAFRVYNPLKTQSESYRGDEKNVEYSALYNAVEKAMRRGTFYVEYKGNVSTSEVAIADYHNNGPQNEIYLTKNQSVAFAVNNWSDGSIIQVSAKAVTGTNPSEPKLNDIIVNSTEMYYSVMTENLGSGGVLVTLTNTGDGVLAISGLKMSNNLEVFSNETVKQAAIAKISRLLSSDKFKPETFNVTAPETARKNRNFSVSATVTAAGVEKVTIKVNSGNEVELSPYNQSSVEAGYTSDFAYNKTYRFKTTGEYTFTITAYDKLGNKSSITKTVTVK